jgi:NAD(P)-dependent dehydrogenase (short-subunit alcohol dehydrogenase family)
MPAMPIKPLLLVGSGLGLTMAARIYFRRRNMLSLQGKVVLITGSSRGLGLALAHAFGGQGARLVLCARQPEPLELARRQLEARGIEVLALPCDIQAGDQIQRMVEQAITHFGCIDVLVNNAGIILVGPASTMSLSDYEASMNTMFWGTVRATLAVLPHMRAQGSGRVVNITSIGGRVSVPHLLPYSSAKFAALGFSEGLHAELAKEGILVTSVIPGLMRTGSHINAFVKGKREQEYTLFGLLATLPLTTTSAASAARQIVGATRRGATELIITPQAQILGRFHGLLPGLTTSILSLVNRALPLAGVAGSESRTGLESRSKVSAWLTRLGEPAAHTYNQYARHDL